MYRFSCKVHCILVRLSWYLNFLDRFSKNTPMCNFIKIRPLGPEIFYVDRKTNGKTDGWTDRHDEANNLFLQICGSAYNLIFTAMFMQFKEWIQMLDYYNKLYITILLLQITCHRQQPSWKSRYGWLIYNSLSQTDNI